MTEGHNWRQLKVVLEAIGYRQVQDYSNEILYFRKEKEDMIIGYYKSNNMSQPYLLTILRRIGLDYEGFLSLYREESK